jgi:hypothetical protein
MHLTKGDSVKLSFKKKNGGYTELRGTVEQITIKPKHDELILSRMNAPNIKCANNNGDVYVKHENDWTYIGTNATITKYE